MKNVKKNYITSIAVADRKGNICPGSARENIMIEEAVRWFLHRYNMQVHNLDRDRRTYDEIRIKLITVEYKTYKCWGQCYESDNDKVWGDYMIEIAIDQSVRDMLATVFHECVHLWQWERGHWKGEGEREATQLQYELADEYWRCGNV